MSSAAAVATSKGSLGATNGRVTAGSVIDPRTMSVIASGAALPGTAGSAVTRTCAAGAAGRVPLCLIFGTRCGPPVQHLARRPRAPRTGSGLNRSGP